MPKMLVLPVGAVEENAKALRTKVDKSDTAYLELKDGIKAVGGLLSPISVREYEKEDGSTGYRLVDGLHRLTALTDLGYSEVPVNVVSVDDSNLLVAQFIGNNNVKTTKSQFAQGLKQLIQHKGYTVKDVAKMVARGEKWVKDQLGILTLPESIQQLVNEDKVGIANALSLKKLPVEKIGEFLSDAMTETPETFGPKIESFLKELKTAAKEGRKPVLSFEPPVRQRKATELKNLLAEAEGTGTVQELRTLLDTQGITDPVQAAIATLKYVLSLDPVSVAAEKAKFDAAQKEKEEKAAKKQAEKEAKAAADAAAAMETLPAA